MPVAVSNVFCLRNYSDAVRQESDTFVRLVETAVEILVGHRINLEGTGGQVVERKCALLVGKRKEIRQITHRAGILRLGVEQHTGICDRLKGVGILYNAA